MKTKWFVFLLILAFIFTGCGQDVEDITTKVGIRERSTMKQEDKKVVEQEGGELQLAMRNTQTLNPLLNADETVDRVLKLIYMPLLQLDETRKPSPCIAKDWTFSEDGKTLFLQLRSDINWHNGERLTANDVIFSLDTIKQSDTESVYKNVLSYISSYQKTGEYSLSITFNQVFSGNLYSLCFPVISQNYYQGENVLVSEKNMVPMGTGYYEFVHYTPTKELKLKKCSNSFGSTPKIDEICVSISADKGTDLYSFEQGIIDILAADVTDMGKYDSTKGTKLFEYTTNYYDFIGFNFERSLFQDKNIRKAVAHALPKDAILESVYLSHATLTDTPVNPSSWLYEDSVEKYSYSLSEASALLEKSNWKKNKKDGVRKRKTNELVETLKVSILVNAENEARKQIAVRLGDELRVLGFEVSIDVEPYETYVEKLENHDFDLFVGGWQMSVVPDYSFMFHSSQMNGRNYISYNNSEVDGLLATAYSAVEDEQAKQAYSKFQKKISQELPYISIAFRNSALFAAERVYGNVTPLENNIYCSIPEWFLYNAPTK